MPDKQKINILHIITQPELGGAQKNTLGILTHLDNQRYQKFLATFPGGMLFDDFRRVPGLNILPLPFLRRSINPLFDLLTLFQIIYFLKKYRINIVHTHSSKAGILGRWAACLVGVPIIIHTVHGWPFHEHLNFWLKKFYIYLERLAARATHKLITVSQKDINTGLANHIGTEENYALIRYGIDKDFGNSNQATQLKRESLGANNGTPLVGMVACLKPQKNPQDFINSAARVLSEGRKVKFILVGNGVMHPAIEQEIKKAGVEGAVSLLGWRRDVSIILPQIDILVLTSLWEGLPVVFLEAMACAKPVVAYDVGGAQEVIQDGLNGFLVKPGDVKELSRKISLLVDDLSLRQKMGETGREIFEKGEFSEKLMAGRIEKLYAQQLLKNNTIKGNHDL